jgi:hypothetical protein
MTTIATMVLTQVGVTLLAIITEVILAATARVVATPPDSIHGRRCFRATMAAGSANVILAAVDSILKSVGASSQRRASTNEKIRISFAWKPCALLGRG